MFDAINMIKHTLVKMPNWIDIGMCNCQNAEVAIVTFSFMPCNKRVQVSAKL